MSTISSEHLYLSRELRCTSRSEHRCMAGEEGSLQCVDAGVLARRDYYVSTYNTVAMYFGVS